MTDRVAAFNALFDANHRDVLGYLARRTEQPADAADLLADVFLTAWRRMEDVPTGSGARMWLFGVARNSLRNDRRGKMRHGQLAARVRAQLLVSALPPSAGVGADVRRALAKLRETDREVLTLTVWEELEPSEIATLTNVSQGAVRVRLHRARRRLANLLGRSSESTDPADRGLSAQGSFP
jgi:RNA polymerase sigma factor (sigma-70 family)